MLCYYVFYLRWASIPVIFHHRTPRRFRHALATAVLTGCAIAGSAADAADRIVASIKPVHSLVSAVMAGVDEPHLIVRGAASPHAFSLRPSDAAALENARVIFLVGERLETFLAGPIAVLGGNARVVALSEAPGLIRKPFRKGGVFETPAGKTHGHAHGEGRRRHDEDHRSHGSDVSGTYAGDTHRSAHGEGHDCHDEDHASHGSDGHARGEGHGDREGGDRRSGGRGVHAHDGIDMHVWLDPVNAGVMVHAIAGALSEADPGNAAAYTANAGGLAGRLDALAAEVAADLASVRGRPFIVFHDAYRYFEDRFGLTAAGAIASGPERLPGARRVAEIRARVRELGATCVFAEPQFEPRLAGVVTEGTPARIGILDPLGTEVANGPELYFTLIRNMAASFGNCLGPADEGRDP